MNTQNKKEIKSEAAKEALIEARLHLIACMRKKGFRYIVTKKGLEFIKA